jgi:hypothetical protein
MKKFKKENKVVRAQAGILVPSSNESGTSTQPSRLVISPVVPNPYVDPMQSLVSKKFMADMYGGEIDEAYKWLTGKSENLPFGVKSLADINRALLPGVVSQSDVNKGMADIAEIVRSGKSPSSIGVMKPSRVIEEPTADVDKSKQKETLPLKKESTAPTIPVKRTLAPQSNKPVALSSKKAVSEPKKYIPRGMTNAMDQYRKATSALEMPPPLMANAPAPNVPMAPSVDLSKLAGEIPKTKSGMKKFMDEYGKFIALGAMAGAGGKGGQIAAPIIAALPGLIEMMKKKKKPQFDEKPMSAPGVQVGMAHGGSMKKGTKKFAEGGKTNSGDRESAFRRLKPTYSGLSFLGTTTPLREDSISKKLMREEDLSYYPFADSEQQRNDKDMKHALASIIDEMYNEKNKLPAMQSEYLPMVIKQSKKDRGTYGFPYDSKIFKELQKGHIQSGKKSSGGEPPKKSEGGAIRKFKGGSMKGNTMDSTLTPKYAKGGDMPKGMSKGKMGKAAGEMPQHKKMAMGKPTPQSMGQKFAKGGAAKYASGGMCKGYGIAKKIRPTGPMN